MMRILFALLLLLPLVAAQPAGFDAGSLHTATWMPIFITTIAALVAIATLVYMLGIALGMMNLKMWAKAEFINALAMVMLVAVLIVSLNAALGFSKSIASSVYNLSLMNDGVEGEASVDHFWLARTYLKQGLQCERWVYRAAFMLNMWYEPFEKITSDVAGPEGTGGGIFGIMSGFLHYVTGNLTYLMVFQYVQYRFLDLIEVMMMPLFLPIGIVLRTFPPTRGAGGLMMAVALGFYFVFPMSYVFIYASAPDSGGLCLDIKDETVPTSDACYTNLADIYVQRGIVKTNQGAMEGLAEKISAAAAGFLFHALFYPLVCLIVTFTFIRQVSAILGADLAEIGRGLIKLI